MLPFFPIQTSAPKDGVLDPTNGGGGVGGTERKLALKVNRTNDSLASTRQQSHPALLPSPYPVSNPKSHPSTGGTIPDSRSENAPVVKWIKHMPFRTEADRAAYFGPMGPALPPYHGKLRIVRPSTPPSPPRPLPLANVYHYHPVRKEWEKLKEGGGIQVESRLRSHSASREIWNVILTGVSNGQVWSPQTMAKVDVFIVQITSLNGKSESDSKPTAGQRVKVKVTKIAERTTELELLSASTSSPTEESKMTPSAASRCPVIAIPAAGTSSNVRGLKFFVRVSIPPNPKEELERKSKRRRRASVKRDTENFVYFDLSGKRTLVQPEPENYTGNVLLFHRFFPLEEKELKEKDLSILLKKSQENSTKPPSSEEGVRVFITLQKSTTPLPDFVPPPKHLLSPPSPPPSPPPKIIKAIRRKTVEKQDSQQSERVGSPPFPLFPVDLGPTPNWFLVHNQRTVSEYGDVNQGEKQLMTMWNVFIQSHRLSGECQMEEACKLFLELHGAELLANNLRMNFTLHLANLFDYGLLTSEQVRSIIEQLDSTPKPKNGGARRPSSSTFNRRMENEFVSMKTLPKSSFS